MASTSGARPKQVPQRESRVKLYRILQSFGDLPEPQPVDMTVSPHTNTLSFLGKQVQIDCCSQSPSTTWKFLEPRLRRAQCVKPNRRFPAVVVCGARDSGKSTTLFGNSQHNCEGFLTKVISSQQDGDFHVRVLEYAINGYRDLVALYKSGDAPISSASLTASLTIKSFDFLDSIACSQLNNVLSKRKMATTARNQTSSRSFICILLKHMKTEKEYVFINMPGVESINKKWYPDVTEEDKRNKLLAQSLFIKSEYIKFTHGLTKPDGFTTFPFWNLVMRHVSMLFVVGCTRSYRLTDVEEVGTMFLEISDSTNKNFDRGTLRVQISSPQIPRRRRQDIQTDHAAGEDERRLRIDEEIAVVMEHYRSKREAITVFLNETSSRLESKNEQLEAGIAQLVERLSTTTIKKPRDEPK